MILTFYVLPLDRRPLNISEKHPFVKRAELEILEYQNGMMSVNPMSDVANNEMNPAYMSAQTAPVRQPSDYPINQRKNSEYDSGMSEPVDA